MSEKLQTVYDLIAQMLEQHPKAKLVKKSGVQLLEYDKDIPHLTLTRYHNLDGDGLDVGLEIEPVWTPATIMHGADPTAFNVFVAEYRAGINRTTPDDFFRTEAPSIAVCLGLVKPLLQPRGVYAGARHVRQASEEMTLWEKMHPPTINPQDMGQDSE